MHAVVTGGAGFIGSTLVDRLLADGHRVDVVDNLSSGSEDNLRDARSHGNEFSFFEIDIRDPGIEALFAERRPEVVFHLAAQTSVAVSTREPLLDAEVNVLGSVRVLDAARAALTRKVVFAASGGTLYGEVPLEDLPIAEEAPHAPSSPYGISKGVVLGYLQSYRSLFGLEWSALALANVYGPRQDPHGEAGVVAIFSDDVVRGRQSTIFGDGEQTRDFVYVADVADAFSRAADAGEGMVINIGSGRATSVNELHDAIARACGGDVDSPVHGLPRAGDLRHSVLSPRRASSVLGWSATTELFDGVRAVVEEARARS